MKYEYQFINRKKVDEKGSAGWEVPPSGWRFVSFIPPSSMLFERVIEEYPTITVADIKTSGTTTPK